MNEKERAVCLLEQDGKTKKHTHNNYIYSDFRSQAFNLEKSNIFCKASKAKTPLECALILAEAEIPVFPCIESGAKRKSPYIQGGFKNATCDKGLIIEWFKRWKNALIGIPTGQASGLFIIDLDCKNDKDGLERWAIMTEHEEIETFTVRTGSGGLHLYFNHIEGLRCSTDKISPGIDTRGDGGYIIFPSPGSGYIIENATSISDIPAFVLELLQSDFEQSENENISEIKPEEKRGQNTTEMQDNEISEEALKSALSLLNPDCDYQTWITIGMALHNWNSIKGFTLWDEWSKQGKKYDGSTLTHWRSFKPDGGITIGTLIKLARDKGWKSPVEIALDDLEIGDARFFSELKKGQWVHNFTDEIWYYYHDGIWEADNKEQITIAIQKTLDTEYKKFQSYAEKQVKTIQKQLEEEPENKELERKLSEARKLSNTAFKRRLDIRKKDYLGRILSLAKSFLPATQEDFDQKRNLICLANGTFDFSTGCLCEHSPEHKLTIKVNIPYDMNAKCPKWEEFLNLIFENNQELISWIAHKVGQWLTGFIQDEELLIFYGNGANGKSMFFGVIQMLLDKYYLTIPVETLLISKNDNSNTDMYFRAQFAKKRLIVASEMPDNRRLSESLVKDLTGGITDRITARNPYGRPFEFSPTHKLVMFGNHKPKIYGTDGGIWRRVRLIPFNYVFPEEKRRDKQEVLNEFKSELPGILAWAIRGYYNRVPVPEIVKVASNEYRKEMDILANFLEASVVISEYESEELKNLYQAYLDYCEREKELAIFKSSREFSKALKERGFEVIPGGKNKRIVKGIKLGEK